MGRNHSPAGFLSALLALGAGQPRALCGTEPLSAQAVDRPEDGPAELLEPICAVKHKRDRDLLADYSVDGYELRSGMRAAIGKGD